MPKKKTSLSLPKFIKKSPTIGIIVAFALALYQLIVNVQPSAAQPVKLPASNEIVELYANQTQDDLANLFVSAINSAKYSITLSIYALIDDQIVGALQSRSQAGIKIFIVCDAQASPGVTRKLPQATIVRRSGQGLMHQKILIIDDQQIIIGSANFTYSSLHIHGNLVMGIDNSALAKEIANYIHGMDEDGNRPPPFFRETDAGSQHVELWILPNDPAAVNRMLDLLRSAQKTIKVAMFTWTRIDFVNELIKAKKRGVKVEAVLDRYSGKGASSKVVTMLQQAGIPVTLSTGKGLLHHKFAYIDDSILVNGSANWTAAAFKSNDDFFAIVSPLTSAQQQKMNRLWDVIKKQSAIPSATTEKAPKKTSHKPLNIPL